MVQIQKKSLEDEIKLIYGPFDEYKAYLEKFSFRPQAQLSLIWSKDIPRIKFYVENKTFALETHVELIQLGNDDVIRTLIKRGNLLYYKAEELLRKSGKMALITLLEELKDSL